MKFNPDGRALEGQPDTRSIKYQKVRAKSVALRDNDPLSRPSGLANTQGNMTWLADQGSYAAIGAAVGDCDHDGQRRAGHRGGG